MDWQDLIDDIAACLLRRQWRVATAESCTGGWVAKAFTDVPGCSHWFDRGFVTYSNESKQEMLGVDLETINRQGAVSELTVRAMVLGALKYSRANGALAISGIAGPGGGSAEKPVGTVWIAWALRDPEIITSQIFLFSGDRDLVRRQSVEAALLGLRDMLKQGITVGINA